MTSWASRSASLASAPSRMPRAAPPADRGAAQPGWQRLYVGTLTRGWNSRGKEIDSFARPDAGRPIILLYGPDAGLVRERCP